MVRIPKRPLWERIKRAARYHYLRILRLDDPPERIARGAAVGVFMGIFPTFGAGPILAIAFSFVFKANKAASVIGSLIMNPLTTTFFWSLSAVVGAVILNEDPSRVLNDVLHGANGEGVLMRLGRVTTIFIVGNLVVSSAFTVASYFIVKKAIIGYRRRKAAHRAKRLEDTAPRP